MRLDDNTVECLKAGVATIEASVDETDSFEAGTWKIQVTITEKDGDKKTSDDDEDSDKDDEKTKYYKVYFVSNGGSDVATQKVEEGDHAEEPTAPIKSGFYFGGWYADKELTVKWDFDSKVILADTTLYAKWETLVENVKDSCTVFNNDIVSYNGVMYFMSGTKINVSNLFSGATSIESSDKSIAKVNKKGVVTFKKNGNVILAADTGKRANVTVFGKKADKVSIKVGDTYTLPDEVLIETLGNVRYSSPTKIVVSDDGRITAMKKGTVKIKYSQSGKERVILKLKISK